MSLSDLPPELFSEICAHLSLQDVLHLAQVGLNKETFHESTIYFRLVSIRVYTYMWIYIYIPAIYLPTDANLFLGFIKGACNSEH